MMSYHLEVFAAGQWRAMKQIFFSHEQAKGQAEALKRDHQKLRIKAPTRIVRMVFPMGL